MDIWEMLSRRNNRCIAFTGAGGKTTLLRRLAFDRAAAGQRVLVYTTTHMGLEQVADMPEQLQPGLPRFLGTSLPEQGKMAQPEPEQLAQVLPLSELVLVEADGSRCHPIKYPAPWEPVLPEPCTVVTVAGLSCLGADFDRVCHRSELARQALDYQGKIVDEQVLARLIAVGYGEYDPVVVLSQADTPELQKRGQLTAEFLAEYNIMEVCLTKYGFSC